jgi:four helix bundle protein
VKFSFEDLGVWKKAVDFADHTIALMDSLDSERKHYRLMDQLEAAVTSIPMNIAEGKGRFSKKEFMQYLYVARGSLFETVTLLEIFKRKGWLDGPRYETLRVEADEIGKMLSALIKAMREASSVRELSPTYEP